MSNYYVNENAQATGEHEVHKDGCSYMPQKKKNLGSFSSCQDAIKAARAYYTNVDGCYWCAPACHKK